jgi:hypothetical protein
MIPSGRRGFRTRSDLLRSLRCCSAARHLSGPVRLLDKGMFHVVKDTLDACTPGYPRLVHSSEPLAMAATLLVRRPPCFRKRTTPLPDWTRPVSPRRPGRPSRPSPNVPLLDGNHADSGGPHGTNGFWRSPLAGVRADSRRQGPGSEGQDRARWSTRQVHPYVTHRAGRGAGNAPNPIPRESPPALPTNLRAQAGAGRAVTTRIHTFLKNIRPTSCAFRRGRYNVRAGLAACTGQRTRRFEEDEHTCPRSNCSAAVRTRP